MTAYNYSNMEPGRRIHFVYRAFDAEGRLLYVGCTMRPELRYQDHRGQSQWFPLATRFTMSGPYDYPTGRRIEREAVHSENPLWNHHEPRRVRARTLRRRVSDRWLGHFRARFEDWREAWDATEAHTELVIPRAWIEAGTPITEFSAARIERANQNDLEQFQSIRKSA